RKKAFGCVVRGAAILGVGGSPILSERLTLPFKSGVSVIKWGLQQYACGCGSTYALPNAFFLPPGRKLGQGKSGLR
ncbi:MAG: hypothetical protein ACYC21_10740, partial [Eubacteriales bacterium]